MGLNLLSSFELEFHESRSDFRICPGDVASVFFCQKRALRACRIVRSSALANVVNGETEPEDTTIC